jgi:tetratricopeptide (TPR) repeat protein
VSSFGEPAIDAEVAALQALGNLLHDAGELKEAEARYTEGLPLAAQLVEQAPAVPDYRRKLGFIYSSLGAIRRDTGRLAEAEAHYGVAVALFRQLHQEFPDAVLYATHLGRVHGNRGAIREQLGRLVDAEADYLAAIELARDLRKKYPDVSDHGVHLASSLANRAAIAYRSFRGKLAMSQFDEAVEVLRELSIRRPDSLEYRTTLFRTLANRARARHLLNRPEDSHADYVEAIRGYEDVLRQFPDQYLVRRELGNTLVLAALLARSQHELAAAMKLLNRAADELDQAVGRAERDPNSREQAYLAHWNRAEVAIALSDFHTAALSALRVGELGADPAQATFQAAKFLAKISGLVKSDMRLPRFASTALSDLYAEAGCARLQRALQPGGRERLADPVFDPLRNHPKFPK